MDNRLDLNEGLEAAGFKKVPPPFPGVDVFVGNGNSTIVPKEPAALTNERGQTHGRFSNHADYTQSFKRIMYRAEAERKGRGQRALTNKEREALEMIFHKIGRILAGQPEFQDHWDDIAGYAHLPGKDV